MIIGGYYIKARKIQNSEIAFSPPHVREIWDWLIKEANHDTNSDFERGTTMRSISDIREGLRWYVGYRKETYSKSKCEMALNWLRKRGMITTTKTTRGLIITVCKYDYYQNPKNYETNSEKGTKPTRRKQQSDTINKNDKNDKEIKIPIKKTWKNDFETYLQECRQAYAKFTKDEKEMELQRELNPGINVELSIKKGFTNYWGTEEGWNNKKEKGIEKINWKTTIKNSITNNINKVYLTKR